MSLAAVLFATVVPITLATSASPAGAACSPGAAVIATSFGAEQVQYSSTCDGDGFYAGQAYDSATADGYCTAVRFKNHGTTSSGWIQGQACTTGGFTNYNAQGGPFDLRVCRGTSTTYCSGWVYNSGA
jgi:hypothetical protein